MDRVLFRGGEKRILGFICSSVWFELSVTTTESIHKQDLGFADWLWTTQGHSYRWKGLIPSKPQARVSFDTVESLNTSCREDRQGRLGQSANCVLFTVPLVSELLNLFPVSYVCSLIANLSSFTFPVGFKQWFGFVLASEPFMRNHTQCAFWILLTRN